MCISSIPSLHQHTLLMQLNYGMAICCVVPCVEHNGNVVEQPHLKGSYYTTVCSFCSVSISPHISCSSAIITDGIKVMTNYYCLQINMNVFIWYCIFVSLSVFTNVAFSEITKQPNVASASEGLFSFTSDCMQ